MKMSTISSVVRVTGWVAPRGGTRPGRVTAPRSASSRALSRSASSCSRRAASSAWRVVLAWLTRRPRSRRASSSRPPREGWASPRAERRAGGGCSASRGAPRAGEGARDVTGGRAPGQVGLLGLAEGAQVGGVGDRLPAGGDDGVEVWGWHGRAPNGKTQRTRHVRFAVAPLGPGAGLGDAGQLQAPAGQAKSQGGALV